MAEFKLGRIRFIWKNDWVTSTVYYKDDVVRNGGNTYVCIAGHTSPALFTSSQGTYWNKISDGQDWKSTWATNTYYKVNDLIKYGGYLYLANEAHTSAATATLGLEADQSKWDLFAEGFDYKAAWAFDTRYKVNDIVKYNGTEFICTQEHTSAATEVDGIEVNDGRIVTVDTYSAADALRPAGTYTDLVINGGLGLGAIATAVVDGIGAVTLTITNGGTQYEIDDVLSLTDDQIGGGGAPIFTFNVATTDEKWDIFTEGFTWTNNWITNNRYRVNDVVRYGGTLYVCKIGHTSAASAALGLEANQSAWDYKHKGIEYKTDWADATRYKINDVVKFGGGIWICIEYHTSQTNFTDDESKWDQFVEGLEFEDSWSVSVRYQPGDFVTYGGYSYVAKTNNVGQTTPNVNGTDWELFTTGFRHLGDWLIGTGYLVGDVIRLGGYTYLATTDNTAQRPPNAVYWERLNTGFIWKDTWTDATLYDAGDSVQHGVNSYVCILAHTSDEITLQNRPDQDVDGSEWNLLVAGAESGNLTTEGDLIYYGGAGATRLPIGKAGQGLRVNAAGDAPEWADLGAINNVFYVATTEGVDLPAPSQGVTIDRPWKTVRYATEQVQAGALRYNAKTLLERNRSFIANETNAWKDAQIVANTGIWLGFVDPAPGKCERDMGQIIDAVVWDMSHGGNQRTRDAALSYFSTGTLLPAIAAEDEQTVAVINYLLTVVDAVISNLAPATIYGSLNRYSNVLLIEEADALATVTTLVTIITGAITQGDTTLLPAQKKPQHSIFVKTGEFEEILPIIIPENTAVVGDELRSTRIVPAGSLIAAGDVPYSLDALDRLKTIISDVVTDPSNITKTTGNALNPVTTSPVGSLGSTAAVTSVVNLTTEIADILTNGIGNADALVFTDSGVAAKTTARTELQANRATIISDLIAWITSTYPSLVYNQASCERDTGYIVDALSYDIQYGGNSATLTAARAYLAGAVAVLPAGQTTETAAALNQLSVIVASYLSGATEETEADGLLQIIEDVVTAESIAGLPAEVTPVISWASAALQASHAALIAGKAEIQSAALGYVTSTWPTLEFVRATCSRDVGLIVDALAYDTAFGSNFRSITAGLAYYRGTASAQVVLANQLDATVGIIKFIKNKAKLIATAGAGALAETLMDDIYTYIDYKINPPADSTVGEIPITSGSMTPKSSTDYTYGVESLEANRAFLVAEALAFIADTYSDTATDTTDTSNVVTITDTGWLQVGTAIVFGGTTFGGITAGTTYYVESIPDGTTFTVSEIRGGAALTLTTASGSMTVDLFYNQSSCSRDVGTYIDAIKHDLIYTGSYKSLLAARYYTNAVTGSQLEDMFYLRNGTGLRNCSTSGLSGVLSSDNAYGTKRPSAGSFTSLDPGWGTTHTDVWITNKSPYVQNVSTFGTGCVGCKIDGALHDGGNDSIVSNDFTQIISDGIGVWCTNLGRTELVSVFSYYGHIGYLAENGGKIRATNGNSSYGTFGTVAEGVDITEVPVTGTVTNRSFQSIVQSVFTDGNNILTFEYLNAGVNYTPEATAITVIGEGYGAAINAVQTVDGGVFEVRLLDLDSDFGGADYRSSSSVAQIGSNTQITLSNTDVALSSQYIGMMVYIIAGVGAGQYGYIAAYNAGTKIALIAKDSIVSSEITSTIDSGDYINIADNTMLSLNMPVYFTGTSFGGISASTIYYIKTLDDTTQFTISASIGGSTINLTDASGSLTLHAAGWDHLTDAAIETVLDGTTTYVTEPRITFSAPPSGLYADTAKGRAVIADGQIARITIHDPGNGYVTAPTVTITDPNNTVDAPLEARIGDGVLTQPTWTTRGNAFVTAQATIVGDGYADLYQPGSLIRVEGLSAAPLPGSNITFASLPGQYYKLVAVRDLLGTGPYTAQLQVSPDIQVSDAPEHASALEFRIRYSQVRLTGHDFLDIGTGNFTDTNYPNIPLNPPVPLSETVEQGGGRVFYTSTDQDGNFRVGGLFSVEQATGIATLNADAFNISGLQELSLGELGLGGTGAVITEFSTDGTFTANSDNIVPTQKAIRTYITSQIGGGAATLNVNTITAGQIEILGNQISTTTGNQINMLQKVNFTKGVDGIPIAVNYFLLG